MTTPKLPCWNCRKRHVKCNKQRPRCGRCETKNLDCVPVERKAVFRRGFKDDDGFAVNQTWVNSEPKKWRQSEIPLENQDSTTSRQDIVPQLRSPEDVHTQDQDGPVPASVGDGFNTDVLLPGNTYGSSSVPLLDALASAAAGVQYESPASHASIGNATHPSPCGSSDRLLPTSSVLDLQPPANVEAACLLRYFIEDLSPWFDHCDHQSHFRLVVPLRARHCFTLRNAIFAVSSRHLSRLPQCKTPQGIVYHGQFLPGLTTSSAVEYMLKCIPGLLSFPNVQDTQQQENLMAAAIILRQYEEMEEEMEEELEEGVGVGTGSYGHQQKRVNFLAITQTIVYSMISLPLGRSSLATAAYWIAVRQEVYYALTRKRVPCVTFTPDDWENATVANRMIMHAGEVTTWCWGERGLDEYERLKSHQQQLITDHANDLLPILQQPPDKSKGGIFPTVWYATGSQVTGVQHLELARMILTAENPRLREQTTPRAAHRRAEAQVRSIVLNLCGIAVDNVSRQVPALVNAVISIMLYGEYFIEQLERDALVNIIERTKDMHAWPLRRPYERLRGQWEEGDSVEV
ncbi:hypothetical protein BJX99DRAFT_258307 [Aspergillus californicus]